LALRNAAAEAGVATFDGQSDAALLAAIKTADNADAIADAVAALAATDASGAAITTLAALDTAYEALANPVITSYTLTTGVDTVTASANADTINAGLSGANLTLNSLDSVDGGAGADTLNVSLNGDVTPGTITGVETINVTGSGTTPTLNFANASGVTSLNDTGSTSLVGYSNLEAASIALQVADNAVGATFAYKASALTGSSDIVNLALSNATAGATTTLTGAIETVNLASNTSANSIRLDSDATTLNISGSADITLAAASTIMDKTTVVNAADASGKVVLTHDHTTAATAVTITGGSGNDTLTLTGTNAADDTVSGGAGDDTIAFAAALTDADTIDGGAGTDTLSGTTAGLKALTAAAKVTNMEALSVSDAHTGTLTAATVQAGIAAVTLAAGSNNGTVVMEAGAKTLTLSGTANAAALTVTDTGLATNDSLTINTSATIDSTNSKDITINGYETVTLSSSTATAKGVDNITINGDPDSAGANTAATLNLTGAASITHTSGGVVTLGAAAAKGTIDASAMTGAYVQVAASVGASTIKGGAGADTLYGSAAVATTIEGGAGVDNIYGGSAIDTISGGAGNDQIFGTAGNDVLNGNDGNDDFEMASAELTSTVTIDGGAGTDSITIADFIAMVDADFTLVSNVETLTSAATGLSATLGTEAMAAGLTTVTLAGTNSTGMTESVTVAKEFTSALTVNLDALDDETAISATDDKNTVDASASSATVSFVAAAATAIQGAAGNASSEADITGGSGTSDSLTLVGATYTAAHLGAIDGIETWTVSDDANANFTTADVNVAAAKTLTIDGRAIIDTSKGLTVDGGLEADGYLVVHGGTGADSITIGAATTGGDTVNTYAGADTITAAVDNLTSTDAIDGGSGSDTLTITGTGTLTDADFTGVTNIEKFNHNGTSTLTTLGTEYMASGSADITLKTTVTNALNLDAITNDQVLNLNAGTDTVDASSMTGALNVKFDGDSVTSADTLTGGTGTGDTLTITAPATALDATDLGSVSGFENIVGADDNTQGITTADAMTAAGATFNLDFSANTTTAVTASVLAETNAVVTLTGGGIGDTLTMSASSAGDTINAGAGGDGITVAIIQLTSADTIDGGAGTDTLTYSSVGIAADSDFTNVSNIEALTLADGTNNIVLGTEYAESGSVTITTVGTGNDTITLGSGVTTAQTIALTGGDDVISAASASGAMTFTVTSDLLDASDTVTGGTGADTLTITGNSDTITSAEMANVTAIETIKVGSNAVTNVSLNDANTVSGVITVNAALATSVAVTFSGAAENDGTINYSGGGGVDTVTGTDTTATGDTISGGAGADVITGGLGGDTITGGAGADVFTFTAVNQSTGTAKDSITDYTSGTDFIAVTIDNSANTSGQTYDATIQTAQAGTSAVQSNMSGSIGQTFFDTTNNTVVVNANADNLVTTLDYQIDVNAAATAANTIAAGDVRYTITGGSGNDTIVSGGGADTINSGTGTDNVNAGAGVDTINGAATAITGDTINGGTGTDTLNVTGAGAITFAAATITNIEAFIMAADAGADAVVFDSADLGVATVSITLTSAVDGDDDTIEINNGGTNFQAIAEASAAAVTTAGEWFAVTNSGDNATLEFFNEATSANTVLTIVGLDAGAFAIASNDIVFTA
jgi:Ca2+-binding RTX toxin-like protein